jgi:hypothetical protein
LGGVCPYCGGCGAVVVWIGAGVVWTGHGAGLDLCGSAVWVVMTGSGAEFGWCTAVEALAGRAKPSRPTVIPAVARMVEGAFFITPLHDH